MRRTLRFLAFPRGGRSRALRFLAVVHSSWRRSQLGKSFTARFFHSVEGRPTTDDPSDVRQVPGERLTGRPALISDLGALRRWLRYESEEESSWLLLEPVVAV